MVSIDEKVEDIGPLEADKSDIREDPYTLPGKFKWDCLDLDDDKQVNIVIVRDEGLGQVITQNGPPLLFG